jgi:uncharacterized protein
MSATLETPQFIESGGRQLYAVHYAPREPRPGAPVVVHCHSLGIEQLTNYRNEVRLARAAAARGIPTLRYHARGHGDSAGDFAEVTLSSLVEDAIAAADHARRLSGAERVVWLGVRFGAIVAAHAVRSRADTAAVALWEPVGRAHDYFRSQLRTMLMSQVAAGRRPDDTVDGLLATIGREGQVDVHGYYLHRTLLNAAREEDAGTAFAAWTGPMLLVQIQARRSLAPAHEELARGRGDALRVERIAEEPGWHFVSNPPWQSQRLVDLTVEWLDALA